MAKSIPWDKMRDEYVSSETLTYADLSTKYGTSLDAVKKRASREKWSEKRHHVTTQIALRTTEKTIELVSDDRAEVNRKHYELWGLVIEKLQSALKTTLDLGEIETLTKALDRAHKGQRLAKEMDRKDEQQQQAIPDVLAALANRGADQPTPGIFSAPGAEDDSREP